MTYIRTLLFILVFSLLCSRSLAEEKIVVGIVPFTGSVIPDDLRAEIVNAVTQSFIETKRFIIVDRTKLDQVDKERNLQKTENFIDGKVVEQGKSLGAQYLITGIVNQYFNDGEMCKMSFSINVVDVATSQILNTTTIDTKKGGHAKSAGHAGLLAGGLLAASHVPVVGMAALAGAGAMNRRTNTTSNDGGKIKVFEKSLNDIAPQIEDFVEENFPASYPVVKIEKKNKKGHVVSVLIAGGKSTGLEEGQKLKIVRLTELEVSGKKVVRKQEIGLLTIEKVEDENFSICKVTDETEDIANNMDAKAQMVAITFKND